MVMSQNNNNMVDNLLQAYLLMLTMLITLMRLQVDSTNTRIFMLCFFVQFYSSSYKPGIWATSL